ncbi:retrovirus-related pol polyprotein from transposon TNT 1-94 [Tanacetum coccineum]
MAMQEELNKFVTNDVWSLVQPPNNQTLVSTKWVFKNKLYENGVVSRNKARLAAQGYNQEEGIDFDETYALVARLESIRILLAYACAPDFKLFQMDVTENLLSQLLNTPKTTLAPLTSPPLTPSQPSKQSSRLAINLDPVELIFSTPPTSPYLFFDSLEDLPPKDCQSTTTSTLI